MAFGMCSDSNPCVGRLELRERERKKEKERERKRDREKQKCFCVCVCVCVWWMCVCGGRSWRQWRSWSSVRLASAYCHCCGAGVVANANTVLNLCVTVWLSLTLPPSRSLALSLCGNVGCRLPPAAARRGARGGAHPAVVVAAAARRAAAAGGIRRHTVHTDTLPVTLPSIAATGGRWI